VASLNNWLLSLTARYVAYKFHCTQNTGHCHVGSEKAA